MSQRKIVIAITGASGAIYAKLLLDALLTLRQTQGDNFLEIGVVLSDNAKTVWEHELENQEYINYAVKFYDKNDFNAPFASGSAKYDTMVIIPCSMGTLGRIATGISNDLITRAADVMLKERRKLILVARETPYNLIHINNMKLITEAGGIICPATPSFYSKPKTVEEVAQTVVNRVIDLMGFENESYRWGNKGRK
ncbi:MAG: 3-octaprenyl-4-hydroxybenzoate carboxy-lyase [Flavobacteriales bacterium CG_4_10_14_0_2_um_filter_32_8]|nr:MAG: 3-octaprenyl-4-hydroxybenzoate carboxy-lyase [Flavobacteriales bacterium CG_4_10_14_0_2_um_filter_32_8]PJB15751.1 MAG: 3-octaprenyl-4-hydroxybenzoate carboxy-lyase [Flavobacteriales bacterium CG_4_9_14_3_um_filter_32_8]